MSVLEIHDLEFDGDRLLVTALIEDAVLVRRETDLDPPEWGPAVCRGSCYLDSSTLIPATEVQMRELLDHLIDDWAPIDWNDN